MKRYGQPGVIVTDRLRSYRAAMNVIGNAADQGCGSEQRIEPVPPEPYRLVADTDASFMKKILDLPQR